tara:strand:+ start:81 stop:1760 length:1680 start_codon:yes stop_codon:yes gene_type:complete
MKRDDVLKVPTLDEVFEITEDNDENRKNGENMIEKITGYQPLDSEEEIGKVLHDVDVHSQYEETIEVITLGELICDYGHKVVSEPLFGQRGLDYTEENTAEWNKHILTGFQRNKSLHLVCIQTLLEGFREQVQSAANENMGIYYSARVDKAVEHLENGKDWHIADGQHRLKHIKRVFSPDSTVPIELPAKLEWTRTTVGSISGRSQLEKYDLRGKCMADMPEDVRHRVLLLQATLEKTTTKDDLLVSERFLSDNSGKPALPAAKVGILARSPLKSQLEQIEKEVDSISFRFESADHTLENWSAMDFLKDRLYAAANYRSVYSRPANGFQSYVMNVIIRLFGDDFKNTNDNGTSLQGEITFADPGFQDGKKVLLHKNAELSEKNYHTMVEILQGMAVAHDKLITPKLRKKKVDTWEGGYKISNFVNDALMAEIILNGEDFEKYKVESWAEILSEFAIWDKEQQKINQFVKDDDGSIKQLSLSNGESKDVERNEGYWHDSNKNQFQNLGFRSEFIREEFCLKKKDSWLSKGWLVESNSELQELISIVGKTKMEFPGQADQL